MKNLSCFLLAATLAAAPLAHAGTEAGGFELGVSTIDVVEHQVSSAMAQDPPTEVSGGVQLLTVRPMLASGVREMTYGFDASRRLQFVRQVLAARMYPTVYGTFAAQYPIVSERDAPAGRTSSFRTSDGQIVLEAAAGKSTMSLIAATNEGLALMKQAAALTKSWTR